MLAAGTIPCAREIAAATSFLSPRDPRDLEVAATQAEDYKGWQVDSFEIKGLKDDLSKRLSAGLVLSGESSLLKTSFPLLYPKTLREDVDRTLLFLAKQGYPFADLEVNLLPAQRTRRIGVVFDIEIGQPVTVDEIEVTERNQPVDYGWKPDLRPGQRFTDTAVHSDARDLRRHLAEAGHAKAVIDYRVALDTETTVDVEYRTVPGHKFRMGDVNVKGAPSDLVPLVETTMAIDNGETYSPKILERGQNGLRQLDLFRQIRFETTQRTGSEPPTLDVTIDVVPREMRSLEVGLGYWTDDLAQIQTRWRDRNLFNGGRGFEARASVSRFTQEGGASIWAPAFFGAHTRATLGGQLTRTDEESFRSVETQLEFVAQYNFDFWTTFRAGLSVSDVSITVLTEDVDAFQERGGLLTVLTLLARRDSSNDRIYPTDGAVTWIRTDWAPTGNVSESSFVLGEAYVAGYVPIRGDWVWASRVDFGLAKPTGDSDDLLPTTRFFAGGSTSMRGFKRRRLGPLDSEGLSLGGEAKLEAGTELRFPLFWQLLGATFLDAGQVWSTRHQIESDTIEYATGVALMYISPVGPIRADVAHRLTDIAENQPDVVFHIAIGHPF